ncbi:MAG: DUF624 domain-containing protein [Lachnospiraceae bacterium]|nr:DUF624 domain-containing protein [Lachnospiraceae bacterium]
MKKNWTKSKAWTGLGKIWSMAVDFLLLGLLTLLLSVPVITAGAAFTAAFEYGLDRVRNLEGGMLKSFFRSFKEHFRQSSAVWITVLLVSAAALAGIWFYLTRTTGPLSILGIAFLIAAVVLALIVRLYAFSLITVIPDRFLMTIKRSFYLGLRHFLFTILMLACEFGLVVAIIYFPPVVFLAPGADLLICCLCLKVIFRKYGKLTEEAAPEEENKASL